MPGRGSVLSVAETPAPGKNDSGDAAKAVAIFGDDAQLAALASKVSGLGYRAVDGRKGELRSKWIAALVSTDFDPKLKLSRALASRCRVILFGDQPGFDFRLAAARAGVEAILLPPFDMVELSAWLKSSDIAEERPLSIVIVDDDEVVAEAYAAALEDAGMRAHVVTDPTKALDEMSRALPDLVLLDMHMPGASGVEVAQIIRQSRRDISLPIVFLSAERDEDRQHIAREIGGDDFITKPVDLERLVAQVRMRAERGIALRQIMEHDSLTGLLNHARFKDRLKDELERSNRTGSPICVCLLDIDHFKRVNDERGHQTGDRVIQTLAHSLVGGLRKIDVVARYGGEEFGVILLDTRAGNAEAVMNKIRERFEKIRFASGSSEFQVTFSAGVAPSDCGSAEQVIEAADQALYRAKKSGRNCVVSA